MAVAASINTNFTATTGNLEKNTKRAEGVVRGFGSRLRGVMSFNLPSLQQVIGASIITTLAKRAAEAFIAQFKELGQLSDQAINLGIDTNQLQGLRFGAEQAGVSAEQLDKAIAKMADTIADAADGDVKEAVDVMKLLGVNAKELANIGIGEQVRTMVEAVRGLDSTTRKLQASRDVFGRSGTQLITFMEGGAAGIDAATAKFRQLGGTLTDIDVSRADEASDSLDRVGVAFDNLGKQLAVNAAPGVTLFANALAATTGAAANAVRSQFALSQSYLEVNKTIADVIQPLFDQFFGGRGGGQRASDLLEADFQKIIGQADEAARRAAELRAAAIGTFGTTGATSRRRVEPAAVESGSTKFIEAVNKAAGGRGDIQKKMLDVEKEQVKVLERIERNQQRAAAAIGAFGPANLGD